MAKQMIVVQNVVDRLTLLCHASTPEKNFRESMIAETSRLTCSADRVVGPSSAVAPR